ncbi:5'-nucleotidase [Christiangramia sp. SM2212]|uniref:5'-nucleotidase n=1 Tax=Christiangramia sediminicola TaxID=3073267 RepID=A0ABU1EN10_9FLAO|nr:5'-nucleotidase [Christiangramia sp. SM2212]MDR5589775.1 5'-nucleotidase [Christiangramia sp. SM2212]
MNLTKYALVAMAAMFFSCKTEKTGVSNIKTERIAVDTSLTENTQIAKFIQPYKEHLNSTLDSTLAYNPTYLSKSDGDLNTAIGNLMADAVYVQANPVFKKQTGNDMDMVLLNHGGIRAEIPDGKVSARTAYQIMPFENEIVVAELTGTKMKEMLSYLEKAKSAHPVSQIKILADRDYKIISASIKGKEIQDDKNYFVATSDYLVNGGDNMEFFKNPVKLYSTGYKIRNAMIDYFTKVDTIQAKIDDRYIRN